jgi:ABC-type transport system substrate-binding protein
MQAGDFDVAIADAVSGPSLLWPYQFWHSGSPNNWGHFSSPAVDAALDSIRHAPDDAAYKAGVAAFQRAIIDDPPAIFLAWSERARAVSTRFEVPVEPGRDVLSTLRLWRPAGDQSLASRN